MRAKFILVTIILLAFAGSFLGKRLLDRSNPPPGDRVQTIEPGQPPLPFSRVVSMAPSITETLFDLGLGDRVIGVTDYCKYPEEATTREKIGGHFNPNFEAIVALRPDLVITLENEQTRLALQELSLDTLVVSHKTVEGIMESISTIGQKLGAADEARARVTDIQTRIDRIEKQTAGLPCPRVLLAVDRPLDSGTIVDVYVAGSDGYFETLIGMAGGQNACPAGPVRFPNVSAEGIMAMKPEVIIDLSRGVSGQHLARREIVDDWQMIPTLPAVGNDRVHVLDEQYATVPGPRFILLLEHLARLIHPEVDW